MGDKPASFSPASLLDALNRHHVAYVLIGRVAARARGATLRTGVFRCRNGRVERVEPPFGVGRSFLEFFLGT